MRSILMAAAAAGISLAGALISAPVASADALWVVEPFSPSGNDGFTLMGPEPPDTAGPKAMASCTAKYTDCVLASSSQCLVFGDNGKVGYGATKQAAVSDLASKYGIQASGMTDPTGAKDASCAWDQ